MQPLRKYSELEARHAKHFSDADQEDANQHLWAVSYSDLLMVLMSFFILYFSFSTPKKSPEVLKTFSTVQQLLPGFHSSLVGGTHPSATGAVGDNDPIRAVASAMGVGTPTQTKSTEAASLLIELPENFYPSGSYSLDRKRSDSLRRLFTTLKAFQSQLHIVVIGHSDTVPVNRLKKRNEAKDNVDLSRLRSGRAIDLALEMGFEPDSIASQGSGDTSRQTRSLTLKLTERRP